MLKEILKSMDEAKKKVVAKGGYFVWNKEKFEVIEDSDMHPDELVKQYVNRYNELGSNSEIDDAIQADMDAGKVKKI